MIFEYKDHRFRSEEEAESVLQEMQDNIEELGACSVGVFLDLCGDEPMPGEDNWGWTDLDAAKVEPFGHGYVIRLTRPVRI